MIKVINFPFCNLSSVTRCLSAIGKDFQLVENELSLFSEDILILPGVGTFHQGMNYLIQNNFPDIIINHANNNGKIIGICLGLQLLLGSSSESPGIEGLSIVDGYCSKIPLTDNFLVPHIGWNEIFFHPENFPDKNLGYLFEEFSLKDFYFVHSYSAILDHKSNLFASFQHPVNPVTAAIVKGNTYGFQFHPEKSGPSGYRLLKYILS